MTQQTQQSIVSMLTSFLMLAFSVPAIATLFPTGTLDYLSKNLPGVVGAVSVIVVFGTGVIKMLPMSQDKKVALAAELPQVSRVVTTHEIVHSPTVVDNPKAKGSVVTHDMALANPPPKPAAG